MTNRDNNFTNGAVELGAPTLIINPPVKPEEKASEGTAPEKADNNDAASNNEGKL